MFPVFENISGTINAAVMVGEISAMFCASSSRKFRQFGLSFVSLFMACGFLSNFEVLAEQGFGFFGRVRPRKLWRALAYARQCRSGFQIRQAHGGDGPILADHWIRRLE